MLAGGTTTLPIIGNVGDFIGGGISGNILGFIILFIFWWFVVGQIYAFIGFAFGGGIGRYHTTKLYRRLQWATFIAFTSIPILISAFLVLNVTPLSIEPAKYRQAVERIEQQRIDKATRNQQLQITQAQALREQKLQIAKDTRAQQIQTAIQARQNKINQANLTRQNAINQAEAKIQEAIANAQNARNKKIAEAKKVRQKEQNKIARDKRRLKQALATREANLAKARAQRNNNIKEADAKYQAAFQSDLDARQARFDNEWNLLLQQKNRLLKPETQKRDIFKTRLEQGKSRIRGARRNEQLVDAIFTLTLSIAEAKGKRIGEDFADRLLNEIFDYDQYQELSVSNCKTLDSNSALICDIVQEIVRVGNRKNSRYIKRRGQEAGNLRAYHTQVQRIETPEQRLKDVEILIAQIEADFQSEFERVDKLHPKPKRSDYPVVDLSKFPEIKEQDFPQVDKTQYPLANMPDLPPADLSAFPTINLNAFPPVDLSQFPNIDEDQFPQVDLSDFPEINENDFPEVNINDFPLVIDDSPINIRGGSYSDRLEPTFNFHFWWFIPTVLIGWIWFMRQNQTGFSYFYSRVMRFLDEGRFGFGGSARFASMLEEWGAPYKSGTLYMGRSLFNPFDEIGLAGEAHMLTVAGSRGGKGTTAIIPNLLLWEGSTVVIDPKGTNAHVTANARRAMGQEVHIIDPFGIVTKDSARFDPFEQVSNNEELVRERITSIADALVIPDDNAKEKHWDDGARTIISGLIAHVISLGVDTPRLHDIRDLISQMPDQQDSLWAEMGVSDEPSRYAKDAAMRYIRGSSTNEILGIMSNADKHTEWLSSPIMRQITSNPTFSISDIKKKPTTIYLVIPPRQLERQSRLLRLFINLVIDAMEDGGKSKIPVLMIMDEFLALGKMPEISTAFATMASYNLTLWPFVQELEKMQAMYGGSFNSFIANSRAVQVFATSDQKTKEYISERIGNRPLSGLSNIAKSNDNLPLRAPNDVEIDLAAAEGRQYIIEAGKSAMLLEKVPYYESKPIKWLPRKGRFSNNYDADPDFNN